MYLHDGSRWLALDTTARTILGMAGCRRWRRSRLAVALAFGGAALVAWWLHRRKKARAFRQLAESAAEPESEAVRDTFDYLLGVLQDAGEGREAVNEALVAARTHITAHFALEDRQRAVRDAERRGSDKSLRNRARRDLMVATLARTLTAIYTLAYARALTHMKLVLLRRAHQSHTQTLSLVDAAGTSSAGQAQGMDGRVLHVGLSDPVQCGARIPAMESAGEAVGYQLGSALLQWSDQDRKSISSALKQEPGKREAEGEGDRRQAPRREARGLDSLSAHREASAGQAGTEGEFLSLLVGPFSMLAWVRDLCLHVDLGVRRCLQNVSATYPNDFAHTKLLLRSLRESIDLEVAAEGMVASAERQDASTSTHYASVSSQSKPSAGPSRLKGWAPLAKLNASLRHELTAHPFRVLVNESIDDGVAVLIDALDRRCFQPNIRVETGQIGEADGGEACGWAPESSLSRVTTPTLLTHAIAITSPSPLRAPSAVAPSASDATQATAPATGWEMPQSPSTLSPLPTPPTRVSLAQLAPVT